MEVGLAYYDHSGKMISRPQQVHRIYLLMHSILFMNRKCSIIYLYQIHAMLDSGLCHIETQNRMN